MESSTSQPPIAPAVLEALVHLDSVQLAQPSCVERLQHHVTAVLVREEQPPVRLADWREQWGRSARRMQATLEDLGFVKIDGQDFLLPPQLAEPHSASGVLLAAAQGQLEYALVRVRKHRSEESGAADAHDAKHGEADRGNAPSISGSNSLLAGLAAERRARRGPPPPSEQQLPPAATAEVRVTHASSPPPSKRAKGMSAKCDRISVLRNGRERDAPILHVKNYNRDRGLRFLTLARVERSGAGMAEERSREKRTRVFARGRVRDGSSRTASVVVDESTEADDGDDALTESERAQIETLSELKARGCHPDDDSYHQYLLALASGATTERVMDRGSHNACILLCVCACNSMPYLTHASCVCYR